ncbi:DNA-binding MarR family transcriptional regulator [Microbacterium ginsengiterrae]|uniref:DNA-binding MarR family transcriptional regulator n=1 Tax=Microbacterium ginsengiterrae TaxID=546115 RepID=A0A7W9CB03_9MICO|nr:MULTISPECIES: MarR family transcriptional regulator [Microbacterium]MBB5742305.1 DNA-binding MarR family transcriptional regulator [Microbacterium ginsengiterrae]
MTDLDDLLHDTAVDLRMATFRLTRRLRRERAGDNLSDAHFAVLGNLNLHGRLAIGELAQRERVSAPTMSNTVDALVESGLVVRVPSEEDRRRVYIEITGAGTSVVTATVHKRDAALADALADLDFTDEELRVLREAAALMRKVAER